MELSAAIMEGLQLCGESASLGDRGYRKLVQTAFDVLMKRKDESAFTGQCPVICSSLHYRFPFAWKMRSGGVCKTVSESEIHSRLAERFASWMKC